MNELQTNAKGSGRGLFPYLGYADRGFSLFYSLPRYITSKSFPIHWTSSLIINHPMLYSVRQRLTE